MIVVKAAEIICIFLSPPRYFGANPTEDNDITDRKGKN